MSRKIVAAELFEDLEVDLWGHNFEVREGTLDVQSRLDKLVDTLQALPDDEEASPMAMAGVYADMLDVLLKPLPNGDGKAVKAKTILLRKFKANEIGLDRIVAVAQQIQEAAAERGHPTSTPATGG